MMNRRDLLALAALPLAAQTSNSRTMAGKPFAPTATVRFGVIGTGERGSSMLTNLLAIDNARVVALCDVDKDRALTAQAAVVKSGQPEPRVYSAGEIDYRNLVARPDIDFVYIATPWHWHVPMAVAAMSQGKHCGVEVPAATTLEGCWELVNASEKYERHCLIMENCCYGYNELMVLNMARAGLFGDLIHGEAAYLHDLRKILMEQRSEGLWRRAPHTNHNGNLYPTHGLGPVASYMDVNRGDRFDSIVSVSSREAGLTQYRDSHTDPTDPRREEQYRSGDINTSIIRTARGRTILLQHDVVNARPYDRLNMISGTKGMFRDYPPRIYIDGQPGPEAYTPIDSYKAKYEHRLWRDSGDLARKLGGHGGMDFVMLLRLVECMNKGLPPDIDVYDAAAWSSAGPLSEQSVARGGDSIRFPDFTRGYWNGPRTVFA